MVAVALVKHLLRVTFFVHRTLASGRNVRRLGGQEDPKTLDEDFIIRGQEQSLKENRVHEYLEDQLKNLNVMAIGRTDSKGDLLPYSFSFRCDPSMEVIDHEA
ncbi:hypothetical protein KP509_32G014700 [Ceratopteris richardii]|nr:hypothetical protein KP509_32G014700 [Ceratopteris richardii]